MMGSPQHNKIKQLKDSLVGLPHKKQKVISECAYLDLLPALRSPDLQLQYQSLSLVLSLARDNSEVINNFQTQDLQTAAKSLVAAPQVPLKLVGLRGLLLLVSKGSSLEDCTTWVMNAVQTPQLAATCLELFCCLKHFDSVPIEKLVPILKSQLLDSQYSHKTKTRSLKLLSKLLTVKPFQDPELTEQVFQFSRVSDSLCKIYSAKCISELYKHKKLTKTQVDKLSWLVMNVGQLVLKPELSSKVLKVLAQLAKCSQNLQTKISKVNLTYEVIEKTYNFYTRLGNTLWETDQVESCTPGLPPTSEKPKLKGLVYGLKCLAWICEQCEETRQAIIDNAQLLEAIVKCMNCKILAVRKQACQCAFHLSRSSKNIKAGVLDSGIAEPLVKLLQDPVIKIRELVTAILANIFIDFANIRPCGIIETLVELSNSPHNKLRHNSVFALKNILYKSSTDERIDIMNLLTFNHLLALTDDPHLPIQEQAVLIVRNLLSDSEGIEFVLCKISSELLELLRKYMHPSCPFLVHLLIILANIASGLPKHKDLVLHSDLFIKSLEFSASSDPQLRVAVASLLINLTWETGDSSDPQRIATLKQLGIVGIMEKLLQDPEIEVKFYLQEAINKVNSS